MIGAEAGSDGTLLIAHSGTILSAEGAGNSIEVGREGTGSLTSLDGFMTVNGNDASLMVGVEAGSDGSVLFNGTLASLCMQDDNAYVGIGVEGTGALSLTDDGVLSFFGSDGILSVGAGPNGTGELFVVGPSGLGVVGSVRIGDGGAGSDTLFGGAGADSFVIRSADAAGTLDLADLITDFEVGVDHLALVDGLTAGDLALTSTAGGDAVVSLQSSGAFPAVLQGVSAVDTSIEELTAAV